MYVSYNSTHSTCTSGDRGHFNRIQLGGDSGRGHTAVHRGRPTYEADHQDAEEDAEHVAEDVHEHDGDEGDGQVGLALPLLALPAT